MAFKFTDPARYPFRSGGIFLGVDDAGTPVGIMTDRHLITIAGARSGKGVALISQNLLTYWKSSACVIDIKGEISTLTASTRAAHGQTVGVVDPYRIAKGGAENLRVSINPLSVLDPESIGFRADIEALSDGFIRRHDPKHEDWADTAVRDIAGFIDYLVSNMEPGTVTLQDIRACFLLPDDALASLANDMATMPTKAGLAAEAAASIRAKLADADSLDAQAFSKAVKEMGWIGDPAFKDVLGGGDLPTFDMSTLKAGTGTLYLVIPPKYLKERGTFLRLFVSMSLLAMMVELDTPDSADGKCLFILDEMHALGRLDLAVKASGLTPGYGIRLWPFFQDLGQLIGLYGPNEGQTFFANADAHIFFGNSDRVTLDEISARIGDHTVNDLPQSTLTAEEKKILWSSPELERGSKKFNEWQKISWKAIDEAAHIERMEPRILGRPRVPSDTVRAIVSKTDAYPVSARMIVFAKGSDILCITPLPYFITIPEFKELRKPQDDDATPKKPVGPQPVSPAPLRKYMMWTILYIAGLSVILSLSGEGSGNISDIIKPIAFVGAFACGFVYLLWWVRMALYRHALTKQG